MSNKIKVSVLMGVLREARGGKCQDCGHEGSLEFAHVKPTSIKRNGEGRERRGRGGRNRYYDIKNNPDCYKLLCCNCHDVLDGRADPVPF